MENIRDTIKVLLRKNSNGLSIMQMADIVGYSSKDERNKLVDALSSGAYKLFKRGAVVRDRSGCNCLGFKNKFHYALRTHHKKTVPNKEVLGTPTPATQTASNGITYVICVHGREFSLTQEAAEKLCDELFYALGIKNEDRITVRRV